MSTRARTPLTSRVQRLEARILPPPAIELPRIVRTLMRPGPDGPVVVRRLERVPGGGTRVLDAREAAHDARK